MTRHIHLNQFRIFALIMLALTLADCTGQPAEPTLTATPQPSITSPQTTEIIQSTSTPTATFSSTQTPSPTRTRIPEEEPISNLDETWYFTEGPQNRGSVINIYQQGQSEPKQTIKTFQYFEDHPEERVIYDTDADPIIAVLYDPVWSPDGQYLAFVGTIDGPSSDLYVYDTKTNEITRLTTGENQAVDPEWSPDGAWIVHGEMSTHYYTEAVWAARPDGSEVKWLYQPIPWKSTHILFWIDDHSFYSYDDTNGGIHGIQIINVDTGEFIKVFNSYDYPGSSLLRDPIYDPESGAVLFMIGCFQEYQTDVECGAYYLSTPWTPSPTYMVPSSYYGAHRSLDRWDPERNVFLTINHCGSDYAPTSYWAVTPYGETSCIEINE